MSCRDTSVEEYFDLPEFRVQRLSLRDFSRELGCFLVLKIKEFFQKK